MKINIIISFLMFFILSAAFNQPKNQTSINLNIYAGFEGSIVPNSWNPLRITAEGRTGQLSIAEPLSVEISHFNEDGLIRSEELLSFNNENRLESSFFSDDSSFRIKIRVLDGRKILSEQDIDTTAKTFPGNIVLTCNIPVIEQNSIKQALYPEEPVLAVPIEIHDFPDNMINYDSVSAIVVRNPGAGFSKAQMESIRAWLSAGGHMVIETDDPGSESIIPYVATLNNMAVIKGRMTFQSGNGSITLIQNSPGESLTKENPLFWRESLYLKPYRETERITAGMCFPVEKDYRLKQNPGFFLRNVMILFLVWSSILIFIIFFFRKNLWIFLAGYTVISALLSLPASEYIGRDWQRGASVMTRAVILPGMTGILLNTVISAKPTGAWLFQEAVVSPWTIKAGIDDPGIGSASSLIHGSGNAIWRRNSGIMLYTIRAGDSNYLNLAGYLPITNDLNETGDNNGVIDIIIQKEFPTVLLKNHTFWSEYTNSGGNTEWREDPELPDWLKDQKTWLSAIQDSFSGTSWLVGRGKLASLKLKIMDKLNNEICWIMPLKEEIKK